MIVLLCARVRVLRDLCCFFTLGLGCAIVSLTRSQPNQTLHTFCCTLDCMSDFSLFHPLVLTHVPHNVPLLLNHA